MPVTETGEELPYEGEAGHAEAKAQNPEAYMEEAAPEAPSSPSTVIDHALQAGDATGESVLAALEGAGFSVSSGAPMGEPPMGEAPMEAPPMEGSPMGGPPGAPPAGNPLGGGMPAIMIAIKEAQAMDDKKKAEFKKEKESK